MDLVAKNNIKVCSDVVDWPCAVREAGELLVESGAIADAYIDNMIEMVHELGPYIVIIPQVGIAHARPTPDVFRDDISLLIIHDGVNFGSANDPVILLFCLSSVNGESHLSLLKRLGGLFGDEQSMERLKVCQNAQQAWEIINTNGGRN